MAIALAVLAVVGAGGWLAMIWMPDVSYRGPLPPLTVDEVALQEALRRDVETLAVRIGPRNRFAPGSLARAVAYLEAELGAPGYAVGRQSYAVGGETFHNLEVERAGSGRAGEIVVAGAHYDSPISSPGANDNATGTAAVLALARRFAALTPARTVRFVAFVNEEAYFQRPEMGSLVYAKAARQRGDRIVAMLSLETIGYYSDEPGSQRYPRPFHLLYPSTGNFVAFVGNVASRALVREAIGAFRRHARFPSEGLAIPNVVPGVGWSDHWAFWEVGYRAAMVTDTALYRYREYHTAEDTADKVDYARLARVVAGLGPVIEALAASP